MNGEKIYNGIRNIRYLFQENRESRFLVVVFSGYSSRRIKAPYNYMNTLEEIKVNKLFIADEYGYDGRGCWYLGENGKLDVADSVIDLISYISNKHGIDRKNIILCGSSKGGFASIYFGMKCKVGHVISGAPQILVAKYLLDTDRKCVLKCIENDFERYNELDNIILKEKVFKDTNINIICGIEDSHLEKHVIPFVKRNIDSTNINLKIVSGNHSDLGVIFQKELPKYIQAIINNDKLVSKNNIEDIINKNLSVDEFKIYEDIVKIRSYKNKLFVDIDINTISYEYACYLCSGNTIIEKIMYKKSPSFIFDLNKIDDYFLRIFVKDNNKNIVEFKVGITFNLDIKLI